MSTIKIDTIPTESKLCSLSDTETTTVIGGKRKKGRGKRGRGNNNFSLIIAPSITVNTQIAGALGGGDAFNFSDLDTGAIIGIFQG